MFTKETREELAQIIAEGVSRALASKTQHSVSVNTSESVEPTAKVETIAEDDDFAEDTSGPTPEEIIAQKKSDAAKKAAATRKKNAADKKAKKEAAANAKAEAEEVDDLEDGEPEEVPTAEVAEELEDGEPEMVEKPAMDRVEFMNTLKRYASKHPNSEDLGRALATEVLKREFDVEKFGDLDPKYYSDMCNSLKEEIKAI